MELERYIVTSNREAHSDADHRRLAGDLSFQPGG